MRENSALRQAQGGFYRSRRILPLYPAFRLRLQAGLRDSTALSLGHRAVYRDWYPTAGEQPALRQTPMRLGKLSRRFPTGREL